jgi:hypothetical protein
VRPFSSTVPRRGLVWTVEPSRGRSYPGAPAGAATQTAASPAIRVFIPWPAFFDPGLQHGRLELLTRTKLFIRRLCRAGGTGTCPATCLQRLGAQDPAARTVRPALPSCDPGEEALEEAPREEGQGLAPGCLPSCWLLMTQQQTVSFPIARKATYGYEAQGQPETELNNCLI